jgi:GDP-4-dehydro-6-deoxy-D-mannose reductase
MRILITGVTGFAGSHLADYCLARGGLDVHGIIRWRSRTENIEHLDGKIRLHECDLRDASSTRDVIEAIRPDYIFHLAAQSFVPTSWKAPSESLITNIVGQLNVFEAVRKLGLDARIQLACSSEEYGMVYENEVPIKETNPLRPLSPYGVSKVGQDLLGYQYFMSYGMKIVRTRGFNHEGPRRAPVFVISDFAKQIVDIERGKRPAAIKVGNLDAKRDFSDVRDVVRGYWLALEKGKPGEVQHLPGEMLVDARDARSVARAREREGEGRNRSVAPEAIRRAAPARGLFEVPRRHRLQADHPLRADAARHAGLLA